jgi:hypothetical protein
VAQISTPRAVLPRSGRFTLLPEVESFGSHPYFSLAETTTAIAKRLAFSIGIPQRTRQNKSRDILVLKLRFAHRSTLNGIVFPPSMK